MVTGAPPGRHGRGYALRRMGASASWLLGLGQRIAPACHIRIPVDSAPQVSCNRGVTVMQHAQACGIRGNTVRRIRQTRGCARNC